MDAISKLHNIDKCSRMRKENLNKSIIKHLQKNHKEADISTGSRYVSTTWHMCVFASTMWIQRICLTFETTFWHRIRTRFVVITQFYCVFVTNSKWSRKIYRLQRHCTMQNDKITIHRVRQNVSQIFLSYLLQNSADSDNSWYIVS